MVSNIVQRILFEIFFFLLQKCIYANIVNFYNDVHLGNDHHSPTLQRKSCVNLVEKSLKGKSGETILSYSLFHFCNKRSLHACLFVILSTNKKSK